MPEAETEKVAGQKKRHKPHIKCQKVSNEEIKSALTASYGIEYHAAIWLGRLKTKQKQEEYKLLGIPFNENTDKVTISRQAIHKRIMRNSELRDMMDALSETRLDMAEASLFSLVQEKNLGAICFLLKCQGKKRGWIERQEVTGADGTPLGPIGLNIAFTDEAGADNGEASTDG